MFVLNNGTGLVAQALERNHIELEIWVLLGMGRLFPLKEGQIRRPFYV